MLVRSWNLHPDYSHGFLVIPLAVFLLWLRRDSRPAYRGQTGWEAVGILAFAVVLRGLGELWHADSLEGFSLVAWIGGSIWLLFGRPTLAWALPAVGFLLFMVPLPYRAETALSLPLQSVATQLGSWSLQLLGQPAMPEGNTILIDQHRMEIERACSGLRVLIGVLALGVGSMMVVRRAWWENALLLLAVVPIALAANTCRIVVAALARRYSEEALLADLGHSAGGWLMIVVAALLFTLLSWYLRRLFFTVEAVEVRGLVVQHGHGSVLKRDDLACAGEYR